MVVDGGEFSSRVSRGDFDAYLIKTDGGSDLWTELRESAKSAELQEIANPTLSRQARRAIDDANWVPIGGYTGAPSFDLRRVQDLCFYLYRNNWLMSNVVDNFTYLTAAGGFGVEWDADGDSKRWEEIAERTRWTYRQMEIIQATFLFGMYFTLRWPLTDFGQVTPVKVKPGVRGVDPQRVTTIKRSDTDPEAYEYFEIDNAKKVHPEDVIFHRVKYVGNFRDGLPIAISVLDPIYWAEKFLSNQHWLHHIRSRVPLIYKIGGGQNDVNAAKSRIGTTLPKPGTIRFANEGEDAVFPDLNLGSTDAHSLYRMFILAVAEGVGLPEFLVGGSAENSAYASLLAQESPTVRKISHFQKLFAEDFCRIIRGLTGKSNFILKIPPVVERDFTKVAEAWIKMYQAGLVTQQTAIENIPGLKWDGPGGEKERWATQGMNDGDFVPEESFDPLLEDAINEVFRKKPAWRKNMAEEIGKRPGGNGELTEAFLARTA